MTVTEAKDFFKQKRTSAEIKAEILPKLFTIWSDLHLSSQSVEATETLLYLDLQAGLGCQEEGSPSASLQILKSIFISTGGKYDLNKSVQSFYYNSNKALLQLLQQRLEEQSYYKSLLQPPVLIDSMDKRELLKEQLATSCPVLVFADPFGAKFSQETWLQALERETSDFLLLFDIKKLVAVLKNAAEGSAWQAFMGERLKEIKSFLEQKNPGSKKEQVAWNAFVQSLKANGYGITPFRINDPGKEQTSYYLCFVSKTETKHARFKELLLPYSDYQEDGVPAFGANLKPIRLLVPEYSQYLPFSMMKLVQDLLEKATVYSSMTLEKIYEKHGMGTPYTRENYFEAISQLKEQGKVTFLNPKTGQMVTKLTYACRVKFKA